MKVKDLFQLLVRNTLTQILVLGTIATLSGILSNWFDQAWPLMVGSTGLLLLIALVWILWAWIINPIRSILDKRKKE